MKMVTYTGSGDKFYHKGLPIIDKGIVTEVSDEDFECLKSMKGIMEIKGIKKGIVTSFKEKFIKEKE